MMQNISKSYLADAAAKQIPETWQVSQLESISIANDGNASDAVFPQVSAGRDIITLDAARCLISQMRKPAMLAVLRTKAKSSWMLDATEFS